MTYGWCKKADDAKHDGDHKQRDDCVEFISDAEFSAQLRAEARERDRKTTVRYSNGATSAEENYVQTYRPY